VYLAAFGKHPGWDDHIDDIGLETDRLAEIKRLLYVEGIAGNIDAGIWDELEQNGKSQPFQHAFVWRRSSEIAIGRIWSSSDGKGRTRYPMILCAECHGIPMDRAIDEVMPRLDAMEAQCKAAKTSAEVRAVLANGLHELRHALLQPPVPASVDGTPAHLLSWLAARPEMGPDHRGMLSILYQIEREMADYRSPDADRQRALESRSGMPTHPPLPLRVPACTNDARRSLKLWVDFMVRQLSEELTVLAIQPVGESWLDIIVGEPTATQLYGLRASPKGVALTTDIPYTLQPEFVEKATREINADTDPPTTAASVPATG
jgi:hypothetical protein